MDGIKSSTRGVFVLRDGKLTPKSGPSVELLNPEMRKLPGDFVTKEVADGERVHVDDEEHVRETIVIDRQAEETKAEEGEKADINKEAPGIGEADLSARIPLNRSRVNDVRFRAVWGLITGAQARWKAGEAWEYFLDPHHLWFEEDNIGLQNSRQEIGNLQQAGRSVLRRSDAD